MTQGVIGVASDFPLITTKATVRERERDGDRQRERGRTVGDKDQKLQTEKRIIHNYRNNKKLGFLDLNFYDCCLCGMSPGHRPHTMQHAYTLSFIYSTHLYI